MYTEIYIVREKCEAGAAGETKRAKECVKNQERERLNSMCTTKWNDSCYAHISHIGLKSLNIQAKAIYKTIHNRKSINEKAPFCRKISSHPIDNEHVTYWVKLQGFVFFLVFDLDLLFFFYWESDLAEVTQVSICGSFNRIKNVLTNPISFSIVQ